MLMFTVQLFASGNVVKELDAEFRTLEAARIYVLDCVVTLNASRGEEVDGVLGTILGYVVNPEGDLVWWTKSELTAWELSRVELKLGTLTPEELECVEFTVDALRKRRELVADCEKAREEGN